jgi:plasmid maintenance system antidote protein VapI
MADLTSKNHLIFKFLLKKNKVKQFDYADVHKVNPLTVSRWTTGVLPMSEKALQKAYIFFKISKAEWDEIGDTLQADDDDTAQADLEEITADKNVGKRFETLLKNISETQTSLSSILQVKQVVLSHISNGEQNINSEILVILYKNYDLNTNWLRNGVGPVFRKDLTDDNYNTTYKFPLNPSSPLNGKHSAASPPQKQHFNTNKSAPTNVEAPQAAYNTKNTNPTEVQNLKNQINYLENELSDLKAQNRKLLNIIEKLSN